MKDVVTKDKAHIVFADEFVSNNESLRQSPRIRLLGIFKVYSNFAAVAKQSLEQRQVSRC